MARLRRAAATPPGRLRAAGAVLAALVLLFGAVAVWQSAHRSRAAGQVVTGSGPLSQDAAEIYRRLADADATAAAGFLLAGEEPAEVRARYQDDLDTASRLLAEAAGRSGGSAGAQHSLTELNRQLPRYAGLVETARAINRQGLPLGGAYLRYASDLMQGTVLPEAQKLADAESAGLDADYRTAGAVPWTALALGVLALAALGRYQVLLFRRTNRVFNPGLLGASLAVLTAVVWLLAGTATASGDLADGRLGGTGPLRDLDRVRIEALQAHTAENLNLVARGASTKYAKQWDDLAKQLDESPRSPGSVSRLLAGGPEPAKGPLADAESAYRQWQERHKDAAAKDSAGDYEAALRATLTPRGTDATADAAFRAADAGWALAAQAERDAFARATGGVDGVLAGQAVAAGVLSALAAAAALRGIGRRLAEYR
ncbi:hypothetical protein [Kitasatospora cheerisanensis]|uniref:Secreted protein n=1 Tax=Kitasatospora cheerisanensis KCTC 2395 TaxID=1348663 RepID=A0A066YXX6_9ACTN|nr:hypothetical protein [Kitasatospora cheerisanensis]KDN82760.1 hypothetical protein KCH_54950 [Kitasatospora cheerisanensis KCTC 2395]